MKVFISHSSKDMAIVDKLYDLVKNFLHLRAEDIVCTSRPGSKLRAGDDTEDSLRQHIHDVPAFLGVITPNSLESTYVICELGARWGQNKHLIPLLSSSDIRNRLDGPLNSHNLLLSERTDLQQLVRELAATLSIELERADAYEAILQSVLDIAESMSGNLGSEPNRNEGNRDSQTIPASSYPPRPLPAREIRSLRSIKPQEPQPTSVVRRNQTIPMGVVGYLKIQENTSRQGEYQFTLDIVNNTGSTIRIEKVVFTHPHYEDATFQDSTMTIGSEKMKHMQRGGNFTIGPQERKLFHAWWSPGSLEQATSHDPDSLSMVIHMPEGNVNAQDGVEIKGILLDAMEAK